MCMFTTLLYKYIEVERLLAHLNVKQEHNGEGIESYYGSVQCVYPCLPPCLWTQGKSFFVRT